MLAIAIHLSPQGHHLIGLALTVYLLGFTACYVQALGKKLDQRLSLISSINADDSSPSNTGDQKEKQLPQWKEAAAIVFPPIWSELLWFRRLWERS